MQGFNPGEEEPRLANNSPVRICKNEGRTHNVRENVT
nr:MAG TPA: hypothetical protein [Caudoviricetes sp.]